MKVIRCQNGHYYDCDVYSSCPHCEGKPAEAPAGRSTPADKKSAGTGSVRVGFFGKARKNDAGAKEAKEKQVPGTENCSIICEPTEIMSPDELEKLMAGFVGNENRRDVGDCNAMITNSEEIPGGDGCPASEKNDKASFKVSPLFSEERNITALDSSDIASGEKNEKILVKGSPVSEEYQTNSIAYGWPSLAETECSKEHPEEENTEVIEKGTKASEETKQDSKKASISEYCKRSSDDSLNSEYDAEDKNNETINKDSKASEEIQTGSKIAIFNADGKRMETTEEKKTASAEAAVATPDEPITDGRNSINNKAKKKKTHLFFGGASKEICPPTQWSGSIGDSLETGLRPLAGWLVGIDGPNAGRSFEIRYGRNTVGRDGDNDIQLKNDNRVSRSRHLKIVFDPVSRGYYIEPGDGSGLVYCNGGIILAPTAVTGGDSIGIGGGSYIIQALDSYCFSV